METDEQSISVRNCEKSDPRITPRGAPDWWRKFPISFSLLVKNFCFRLVFCENFQYFITFTEVSESADGLQIWVNLANPKIRNSVVIIFYSNSSNPWRMIFQNPKKFSKYDFSFKSFSNLKYLRIFTDFRPFTNIMYGKSTYRFTVELCERF